MYIPEKYTTSNDLNRITNKLKVEKSPGYDLITNEINAILLTNKPLILFTLIYNSVQIVYTYI